MTSFIEVPQITYSGQETLPIYLNVADVVSVAADYDGGTVFTVRDLGSEGCAKFKSYMPIGLFLDQLGELARFPGVRSWSPDTKVAFREPAQERARKARDAERAYAKQGG